MKIMLLLLGLALQEPAPLRVEEAVKEFESRDLRQAYRTVERLAELGESALPEIERRAKSAEGRTREWLSLAAEEIRARRDLKDAWPSVARVTMQSSDKTLAQALADLQSKTGAAIVVARGQRAGNDVPIALDLQDVTFIEALDAVCKAGSAYAFPQNGQMQVYGSGYRDGEKFFFGHFMFRIETMQRTRDVTFRAAPEKRLCLYTTMLWDPRLRPFRILRPCTVTEARDDRGKDLVPRGMAETAGEEEFPYGVPEEEGFAREPLAAHPSVALKLLFPSPEAEKIAMLRGHVSFLFVKEKILLKLEKPEAGKKMETEGFEVVVTPSTPPPNWGVYQADFRITSPSGAEQGLRKMPVALEIFGKGGERMAQYSLQRSVEGPLVLRVLFQSTRGARLAGEAPSLPEIERIEVTFVKDTVERRIPFEFRDVKLK